jgi:hypothetical protein
VVLWDSGITFHSSGAWKEIGRLPTAGGVSRGGVCFGVPQSENALLGSAMLLGRDLDRLERWKGEEKLLLGSAMLFGRDLDRLHPRKGEEKRRLFCSSLGLSVSIDIRATFCNVMSSGSSEPSRDDVSGSYITQSTFVAQSRI